MNFAYGGSGVLKEAWNNHNMAIQIKNLKRQIEEKVFTKYDLESSVAIVSHAGNDYTHLYLHQSGTVKVSGSSSEFKQLLVSFSSPFSSTEISSRMIAGRAWSRWKSC